MVLTWIGIVVMVAVIVDWVLCEDRRLHGHRLTPARRRRRRRDPTETEREWRRQAADRVPAAADPREEFEAMIAISIICVIVVLVIILATNIGNEFRPTV